MTITNLSTLLLVFSFLLQKGLSFRNLFLYRTISSKVQHQQQRSVNQHYNIMSPQAKLNLQTTTTTTTSLNANSIQPLQNQNNEQFPNMDETFDRLVAKLRPYADQSNEQQQQQQNKQLWVGIAGGPGSGTFQQQLQFHCLKNNNYS
jgi:hypothetical protein